MEKIRLLLLDDHALFRESLSRVLDAEPDFEIVGSCGSLEEALEVVRTDKPDLVLLDFDLGEQRGSEFLAHARKAGFEGRILLVTAGVSDADTVQLLAQEVSGIFLKHSSPAQLVQIVRRVMAGETWLDPRALKALIKAASQSAQPERSDSRFTQRERRVLRGVFEGLANKEIADHLRISEASVKASLQQLFRKTGVRTRSQLMRIALEEHAGEW
jgi:DNA-binding NarL/FixJ family response regulator